tara:strand:- start:205 stop:468 length:264 start_codon:yes stop_codon:yes gene_type:complete
MKKFLLGLVVAVMMTGSGYAYEQKNWDRQNWSADLKEKSCEYAHFKSAESLKILYAGRQIEGEDDAKEHFLNQGFKYASLWSAMCKD